jgi:hypothetical protein
MSTKSINQKSTRRMEILPGIIISWTRKPQGNSILQRNGYSAENYQLMDADSDRHDQRARKILWMMTIPGLVIPNALFSKCQFFVNLSMKISFRRKISLICPFMNFISFNWNKKRYQNLMKLSH